MLCATSCRFGAAGSPVPMSRNWRMPCAAEVAYYPDHEGTVGAGRDRQAGQLAGQLVPGVAVGPEVVFTAEPVLIDPRRVWPVNIEILRLVPVHTHASLSRCRIGSAASRPCRRSSGTSSGEAIGQDRPSGGHAARMSWERRGAARPADGQAGSSAVSERYRPHPGAPARPGWRSATPG
jgi:hypothetical protein